MTLRAQDTPRVTALSDAEATHPWPPLPNPDDSRRYLPLPPCQHVWVHLASYDREALDETGTPLTGDIFFCESCLASASRPRLLPKDRLR